MSKSPAPSVKWDPRSLARHHIKRTTKDKGCFEDLLGISRGVMTESQYSQRSLDTVANAWAEYIGQGRDVDRGEYYEKSVYYVDEDLVCSITDIDRKEFATCFHKAHESGKHFKPDRYDNDRSEAAIGDRRLRYGLKIKRELKGGLLVNYTLIKGEGLPKNV